MSLQHAANYIASQGRGGDSTLVHMSPQEVNNLQAIAMAHGGSLSVNPSTGLPEAGFLSNLLPMIAGAALMATGVGAPMAALMVGGGTAAMTGSLNKGIMAGLGAFGGAGMGAGLMGAGSAAGSAGLGAVDVLGQPMTGAAQAAGQTFGENLGMMGEGLGALGSEAGRAGFMGGVGGLKGLAMSGAAGLAPMLMGADQQAQAPGIKPTTPVAPLKFDPGAITPYPQPDTPGYGNQGQNSGREQRYFNPVFSPLAQGPTTAMPIQGMADGGPVEAMSQANAVGANTNFPMANIQRGAYATPYQQPISQNVITGSQDTQVDPYTGQEKFAGGGLSHLGDYSDGGRLLRGPGDGVSDSIPATIGDKQPARLADGEFVVPARIVSELGNGSTEAGARKLYAMMDRVQQVRGKTVGKGRVARNTRADKYLPA